MAPGNGGRSNPARAWPQRVQVMDMTQPTECPDQARAYLIVASLIAESSLMYAQPISNSYHLALNLAECGSAWWLLWSSSPASQMAIGEMFRLSSLTSKFR